LGALLIFLLLKTFLTKEDAKDMAKEPNFSVVSELFRGPGMALRWVVQEPEFYFRNASSIRPRCALARVKLICSSDDIARKDSANVPLSANQVKDFIVTKPDMKRL
jgi:hypothetical protein